MINERRLFQSTFELEDRKEGMMAFLEKDRQSLKIIKRFIVEKIEKLYIVYF